MLVYSKKGRKNTAVGRSSTDYKFNGITNGIGYIMLGDLILKQDRNYVGGSGAKQDPSRDSLGVKVYKTNVESRI